MPGFTELHADNAEVASIAPGLVVRRLWRSGPERTARRALAVDFEPGAAWPGVDDHEPGPEEVFVVSGTFTGLTGPGSQHEAGTFIHCDAGSSHSPSTATGGRLFVYYPEG
jgi:quercetin dioxygenase-like cupin family protein